MSKNYKVQPKIKTTKILENIYISGFKIKTYSLSIIDNV